ncbi:PI-PLC X domain-containing protein 3 [Chrysoperla carnea]|uniref:PI-PLC X domain-containing protein 3 n=1 Tax=Chrysoperla carnea TaxID=189513 RepID=UPI001D06A2D6|nr:PI-PLC X domain-containing protein 3 [Chrysoperla carnea]
MKIKCKDNRCIFMEYCWAFCSGLFSSTCYGCCNNSNKIHVMAYEPELAEKLLSDLSNWMGNLPDHLKTVPFYQLAIPGSHDSITYTITSNSDFAPDAEEWMQKMAILGKPLKSFISRWSRCQEDDTATQLENGIRYLDYRLATKKDTDELFICHALYGDNATDSFHQVQEFITKHSGEIVILDLQHFYGFEPKNHKYLLNKIDEIFGDSLLHYDPDDVQNYTLDYLTNDKKCQVIIIYRDRQTENPYWNLDKFPTPWPDTTDSKILFEKLDEGLKTRNINYGYVSQCIYTPDGKLIAKNFTSNLKRACAVKLLKTLLEWLRAQSPGPTGRLNVTIADFVGMNDWIYTKSVIMLNLKL